MSVYVAVTHGGMERRTARDLQRAGVPSYTPSTIRKRWISNQRWVPHHRAIFATYLFFWSTDVDRDFAGVAGHAHVIGVLGRDAKPQRIDEQWLAWIMLVEAFGHFDYTLDRTRKITVGSAVKIIGSAFAALGYSGNVVELRSPRFVVSTKAGKLVLDASSLELLDKAA